VLVLIGDADKTARRELRDTLEAWGYRVVEVSDGTEALGELQKKEGPKLAILDGAMAEPGIEGVCRRLQEGPPSHYVYVLALDSEGGRESSGEEDSGPDDHVPRPLNLVQLKSRIGVAKRFLHLQQALLEAREALKNQSNLDPLTGIENHTAIMESVHRELARSRRDGRSVGIILADLDHLSAVNDDHGTLAGDAVLREAAQRLRRSIRCYDAVGRYGPEEYLLVLPGCDLQMAYRAAIRLRKVICGAPIETAEGPIEASISLGVTSNMNRPAVERATLIREADQALRDAKSRGRNRAEMAPQPGGAEEIEMPPPDPV
jgi:two-component system cell cycle response regulator